MSAVIEKNGETGKQPGAHLLSLDGRRRLDITGVEEVDCFDDTFAVLRTSMGRLEIRGEGLKILDLSSGGGDLSMSGKVSALFYPEDEEPSLFGRRKKQR